MTEVKEVRKLSLVSSCRIDTERFKITKISFLFTQLREEEQRDENKTFIFEGEGHTLGNALKMLLLKKYILSYLQSL